MSEKQVKKYTSTSLYRTSGINGTVPLLYSAVKFYTLMRGYVLLCAMIELRIHAPQFDRKYVETAIIFYILIIYFLILDYVNIMVNLFRTHSKDFVLLQ